MSYKWIKEPSLVRRLVDGVAIPNDPCNADWLEFQRWVSAGGVAQAEDSPLPPTDYNDFNNWSRHLKAKCISDLAFRLGKAPGQLTSQELLSERNRIKAIADVLEEGVAP